MDIVFVVLTLLITLFDLWSTDYTLKRGATELNVDFKDEHRLTKDMVVDRAGWTAAVFILYLLFGLPILIVYCAVYSIKMITGNLITVIKVRD